MNHVAGYYIKKVLRQLIFELASFIAPKTIMKRQVILFLIFSSFIIFQVLAETPRYVVKYKFGFKKTEDEIPRLEEKIVIDEDKEERIMQCLESFKSKENPFFKRIDFDAFSKEYVRCVNLHIVPQVDEEDIPFKQVPRIPSPYDYTSTWEKFVPTIIYKGESTRVDETCELLGFITKQFDHDLKIESSSSPTALRDPQNSQVDCTANENPSTKPNNEFSTELQTERNAEMTMTDSTSWEVSAGFSFSLEKIGLSFESKVSIGGSSGTEKVNATSTLHQLVIAGKYDTANKSVNVVSHAYAEKKIERQFSMQIIVKGWLYVARGIRRHSETHTMFNTYASKDEPNNIKYENLYAFPVGDMAYFFDEFFTRVNSHSLIYKLHGELEEKVVDNFIRAKEYPLGSIECHKNR